MTQAMTPQTWPVRRDRVRQMGMTHARSWARPWPSSWLDRLRGTERRARRRRAIVAANAVFLLVVGVMLMWIVPSSMDTVADPGRSAGSRGLAVAAFVVAVVLASVAVACRPIAKVTCRAWLAGWWHARGARRDAVNAGGHPSARARRRVQNRAAWAAQRQRSGRAARHEYQPGSGNSSRTSRPS